MTKAAGTAPSGASSINRAVYRVLFADTDALGIVYYANYLKYFEVGRAEWFREFMRPPTDYIAEDFFFVAVEARCRYRRPARYDDLLTIETRIGRVDRVRVRLDYRVLNADDEPLVEGYTVHTVTDKAGKLRRFPKEFIDEITAHAAA